MGITRPRQLPHDENAERAARFALAAALQGQFWQAHERLYTLPVEMPQTALDDLCRDLGLDADRLAQDMASATVSGRLAQDRAAALAHGITKAPVLQALC